MSNIIRASIFNGRRTPPVSYLKTLVVKGGVEAAEDLLKKNFSWDGKEVITCPIFTINEHDGVVKHSRWALLGNLGKKCRLMGHNLFAGAEKNIVISMKFYDLKIFEFGANLNNSYWVESTDLEGIEIYDKVGQKTLSEEEAEEKGVGRFCVRAFIQPESHCTALVWIAVVPYAKEVLRNTIPTNYNKPNCPQIPLVIGEGCTRAKRVKMFVREKEREGFGVGCFPLLEALYPGPETLPDPDDLKECVTRFMRSVGGLNNRSGATVVNAVETPTETVKETPPQYMWPPLPENVNISEDDGKGDIIYSGCLCIVWFAGGWRRGGR